jgi:hypothetical protein
LQPTQRRQLIDQLISTQPASVQQSYQKFNQLLQEHKNKFGISLETEVFVFLNFGNFDNF